MGFTICVVGLGLMGASMAGALKGFENARVVGCDGDAATCERAVEQGFVASATTDVATAVQDARLVLLCVYARHIPGILRQCAPQLLPGAVLADICGVKQGLYQAVLPMLPAGVSYVGIHPMAGRERDGIENADAALYAGSGMLVCPTPASTPAAVRLMEALAVHIGCARVQRVDYQKHDEIIAYTSDLMHIAAAGLCLDYHPEMNRTFTAGAFRDCTRVADINAGAWAELLLENRQNVQPVLQRYIEGLEQMLQAVEKEDEETLKALLQRAGNNKREMLKR